jgi:spore maturation protein CgeB
MRLIVFGLTLSSSWGNGHATLWRGLSRALANRGHQILFFERNVPYYALNRDLTRWDDGELVLYEDWIDALSAYEVSLEAAKGLKVFYDLDTPVTLAEYQQNGNVAYVPRQGLRRFDLVLSFAGGQAPALLKQVLGAREVAILYAHVDPKVHHPSEQCEAYQANLSYLGTFASGRQDALEQFFIEPARQLTDKRFLIGGALYPKNFPWLPNIHFVRHLPPSEHPQFFSSSDLTLNVTRPFMAKMGFCPSGRLFEAAACQTPILSDDWSGIEEFFKPGEEILLVKKTADVVDALALEADALNRLGAAGRRRALAQHTSEHRACELEEIIKHL